MCDAQHRALHEHVTTLESQGRRVTSLNIMCQLAEVAVVLDCDAVRVLVGSSCALSAAVCVLAGGRFATSRDSSMRGSTIIHLQGQLNGSRLLACQLNTTRKVVVSVVGASCSYAVCFIPLLATTHTSLCWTVAKGSARSVAA